jgi:hypothetical protein
MQQPDARAFARFVKDTAKPFPSHYQHIKSFNLGLISLEELEATGAARAARTAGVGT